jgi:hypothetical protein
LGNFWFCFFIGKLPKNLDRMDRQTVLRKFGQVLAQVPLAQQRKLAGELAKMVPARPDAVFDWRANWAYDLDRKLVEAKFQVKVTAYEPHPIGPVEQLLASFVPSALPLATSGEALEKLAADGEAPYQLACWKVAFLPHQSALLRFTLSAPLKAAGEGFPELAAAYAR